MAERRSTREAKRLQTRERLLGAAIAEFKRSGMAEADVGAVVNAAGVAHGTFFFHFPTKQHRIHNQRLARQSAEQQTTHSPSQSPESFRSLAQSSRSTSLAVRSLIGIWPQLQHIIPGEAGQSAERSNALGCRN